ncbi:hypothetical protein NFI96_011870 [Prochilodus magdalenae]|nr:hypothetical protein NFI96_011870 [Prochilodus magdalenae]
MGKACALCTLNSSCFVNRDIRGVTLPSNIQVPRMVVVYHQVVHVQVSHTVVCQVDSMEELRLEHPMEVMAILAPVDSLGQRAVVRLEHLMEGDKPQELPMEDMDSLVEDHTDSRCQHDVRCALSVVAITLFLSSKFFHLFNSMADSRSGLIWLRLLVCQGNVPPGVNPEAYQWFQSVDTDHSGYINLKELRQALVNSNNSAFNDETCLMMLNMFDKTKSGRMDVFGFSALWMFLQQWRALFNQFDRDRSGSINNNEMHQALSQLGYNLSPQFIQSIMSRYAVRGMSNGFQLDRFIQVCTQLQSMTQAFREKDTAMTGNVKFEFEVECATAADMWPVLWTAMRTYAPYVTFPVAFVVGAVGYHLEWFIRGTPQKKPGEEKGILELREDRKLEELVGRDSTQVLSLKDKLEFTPKAVLERNRPEKS